MLDKKETEKLTKAKAEDILEHQIEKKEKKKKKIVKKSKDRFPLYDFLWRVIEFGLSVFILHRFY